MTGPRQLALDLAYRPARARGDFLISDSNRAALAAITGWRDWPGGRLALTGPEGAGKTHLVAVWAEMAGAAPVPAAELTERRVESLMAAPAIAVEDVDRLAAVPGPARRQVETHLFHLHNLAAADGASLLVTGRAGPGRWPVETPDLASRLSAMAHVAIAPPDDALLSAVLRKLFADRNQTVGQDVIEFLVRRMERSFAAARDLVARLDRMALAERRRITRPLAADLFASDAGEPARSEED